MKPAHPVTPIPSRFARSRALLLAAALAASLSAIPAVAADSFDGCLARLRAPALKTGVSAATFDTHTATLAPDMSVLDLLDFQPEFRTPIWDYMAALVDDERVTDGQAGMERWRADLQRASARYGVDPAVIAAVWGVESNYGQTLGERSLLVSLSTLSCYGRRQAYFRGEFFATLKIIQDEGIAPEKLRGSWAGAFGQTQFMPSTYLRLAVDGDGDGRRDLIDSVPDALASTANFLKHAGWNGGMAWGYEVRLPAGFNAAGAGRKNKRALSHWAGQGITRADGRPLPASDAQAALLLPAGRGGPAFLVTRNFDALYSYNAAESYALAIAHLSDRLRGGGPLVQAWPTDDPGLSRAERRELQTLLIARGYDIGEPDGLIGAHTRNALQKAQRELGLPADGRAGQKVLRALRGDAG